LDGWRDAAEFLLSLGYPPMVPLPVARALWRRGDRELALRLAQIRGAG